MPDEEKVAQAVIVDPIKEAIRRSNEAERARKRKAAELAAGPIVAELNARIAELEAEKATLAETCKAVQNSNEALRSANVGLTDRVNELGKENTALNVRISQLESGSSDEPTPPVNSEEGGKKVRGKKA